MWSVRFYFGYFKMPRKLLQQTRKEVIKVLISHNKDFNTQTVNI